MLKQAIFQNFRGLNRTSDRLNSPPDFIYDLLNGFIKKDVKSNLGVVTQRDGSAKFNSVQLDSDYGTTKKIRIMFEAKWDGGSTDVIIRAGTAWGKFDGINTFDAIDTGRADDAQGQCIMFKNELIMADGGKLRKSTAAGAISDLSSDANLPDKSDCVWVHRDKVWTNDLDTPMLAVFCKTNSANGATSWTGATDAGTLDLSTVLPVGDRIRGYRTYGGSDSGMIAIICDKYTVIYAAGANVYTFTFVQYFPTTCLSINGLAYVGNDIVYPSRDSLTSLIASYTNNQLEVKPLSNYINNLWRDLIRQTSDTTQIAGVFHKKLNHYYITFPISNNYQTLVYSADIGNFVGRWVYPYEIYSWCERIDGTILSGSDGYAYTMNTGNTDEGTTVSWKMAMPALYLGSAVNYKKPIEFEALVQGTTNLDMNIDYWYGIASLVSDKVTKVINIGATSSLWFGPDVTAWDNGTTYYIGDVVYDSGISYVCKVSHSGYEPPDTDYWNVLVNAAFWDVAFWDMQGNTLAHTSDLLGRGKMMFLEFRNNTSGAQITLEWFRVGFSIEGVN